MTHKITTPPKTSLGFIILLWLILIFLVSTFAMWVTAEYGENIAIWYQNHTFSGIVTSSWEGVNIAVSLAKSSAISWGNSHEILPPVVITETFSTGIILGHMVSISTWLIYLWAVGTIIAFIFSCSCGSASTTAAKAISYVTVCAITIITASMLAIVIITTGVVPIISLITPPESIALWSVNIAFCIAIAVMLFAIGWNIKPDGLLIMLARTCAILIALQTGAWAAIETVAITNSAWQSTATNIGATTAMLFIFWHFLYIEDAPMASTSIA